ncbi:MAG: CBS domain-containing protein [Candidatus Bruticola sp.]
MQIILSHSRADFGALASLILARHLYPQGHIYLIGRAEPRTREFIVQNSKRLNVHFEEEYHNEPVELVVLVGVREPHRLGKFSDLVTQPYVPVHIYDNHQATHQSIMGDFEFIEENGSSVTVLRRVLQQKKIDVSTFEATLSLLGLYEDTGSLTYSSTTCEDFLTAAYMLKVGGRLEAVSILSQRRLSSEQKSLVEQLLCSASYCKIAGRQCLFVAAQIDYHLDDLSSVADQIMEVENPEVLFCVINMAKRSYIVARSLPASIDVFAILHELGGAGHATSAFACVKLHSLDKLIEEIKNIAESRAPRLLVAQDIMSAPVEGLDTEEHLTVAQAAEKLQKMSHSAVCACRGRQYIGMLSRADIDKALLHGLQNESAETYINQDCTAVAPDTPISEVRRILAENSLGCAPVLDNGKLIGIVSKIDILRALNTLENDRFVSRRDNLVPVEFVRLSAETLTLLKRCGEIGSEIGLKIFAVGGFVRDMLLHIANNDIDLVAEGDGISFAKLLAERLGGVCKVHETFATAQVCLPDGLKLDVVTARTETYTRPAALPDVQGSTLKQDLFRRDFSINAMALQLDGDNFGQLIDFFGARSDLEKGTVRILHNLSFVDDPTRIFRAIKFEQRYGFHMDRNTVHLLRSAVNMGLVKMVSAERLGNELWQILQEPSPRSSLIRMDELQVLQTLDSRLELSPAARAHLENGEILVREYRDLLVKEEASLPLLYLNILLIDALPAADIANFIKTYALFPGSAHKLLILESAQMIKLLKRLADPQLSKSELYQMLKKYSLEGNICLAAHSDDPLIKSRIADFVRVLRFIEPPIKGADLIKMGYKPGPQFSQILQWTLQECLEERISSKEEAERAVLSAFPLPN